ncbi:hypothetical protein [Xenophilus sp. Marseille-Q4582]|uniref:hypothetical protein n=1 Tax=Xenophilus sp. Marseille-Q4582 TaxID=2866600 RepID=UPI001CE428F5|nr:hypothetical protein [Xenophilus sp. Marseille-Q4582]
MNASHRRLTGFAGALGALALLGGCVATGPVGYDDYPYDYGGYGYGVPAQVDIDVYSGPGYRSYPPGYYYGRPGYDRRWDGGYRRPPPRAVVPVPVPVPVPAGPGYDGRPPGGWHRPGAQPPQPGQPRIRQGQRIPGLPSGSVLETTPVPLGDRP